MKDIIVVDIETTGLCRLTSQIVNIGAVHLQSDRDFYVECQADSSKDYFFHPKSSEINGTDPEEFKNRTSYDYATQVGAVNELEEWINAVTQGREFVISGLNLSAFDMMILCRTQKGNFDFTWGLGHRFLEIGTLMFALCGELYGAEGIAKELGTKPEDKLHTGIGGARHEVKVLKLLFDKLGLKYDGQT